MITYSLYLVPTRPSEMAIIIKSLKCSANITQNISNIIYKRDAQVLAPFILILFNKLTEKHTFPDDLKRAKITPVHKGDDQTNINNKKPVSNL